MPTIVKTVDVEVDIDIDDVLDELDDADLVEELRRRKVRAPEEADYQAIIIDIRRAVERKEWNEALALIDRSFEADGAMK